jgi:ubiquinone/menaquinone biosynthesis C-methylase UbiE
MDIIAHNRAGWDREVEQGNEWTIPVSAEAVAAARRGEWEIYLSESKPVPHAWFPNLKGTKVLCLASGGGQQGPILAAAGAKVTVFDNSPKQLAQDRWVAQRDGLEITTVQGDMTNLSVFSNESFDLMVHPPSNLFVPDIHPVWHEAFRVLRHGGLLLAGFLNPVEFIFDEQLRDEKGIFQVRYALPYSDLNSLTAEEHHQLYGTDFLFEFSHTLEDQIGGQLEAGFVITGLYESYRANDPIANHMPSYIVTRALKPAKAWLPNED